MSLRMHMITYTLNRHLTIPDKQQSTFLGMIGERSRIVPLLCHAEPISPILKCAFRREICAALKLRTLMGFALIPAKCIQ